MAGITVTMSICVTVNVVVLVDSGKPASAIYNVGISFIGIY